MEKSGQGRRERYKARKKAEAEAAAVGEHWKARTKKEEKANNALVRLSLRWRTDATEETFVETEKIKRTSREVATIVTRRNMQSPDAEVANTAVRNLIAMEAQNRADEKDDGPKPTQLPQQHVHIHQYANAPPEVILEAKVAFARLKESAIKVEAEDDGESESD